MYRLDPLNILVLKILNRDKKKPHNLKIILKMKVRMIFQKRIFLKPQHQS